MLAGFALTGGHRIPPLPQIRAAFPNDVAVLYYHFPLSFHAQAYPAARAAECAGEQGKFEAFHELLYARQDSLGVKPYDAFARESGVADLKAFRQCNSRGGQVQVVEDALKIAKALGVTGTPTVVVAGTLFIGPDSAQLAPVIQSALASRKQ